MQKNRTHNHTRTITLDSYECEDGTVELELKLLDFKHFGLVDRDRGAMEAGDPVHDIRAAIKIDPEMEVLDISADFAAIPFSFCRGGGAQIGELAGKRLDRGWRQSVRAVMGGTHGCTHLSELLLQAPTLAFQTKAIPRERAGKSIGDFDGQHQNPPFFLDGCHSWAIGSPVTARHFPQFDPPDDESADG